MDKYNNADKIFHSLISLNMKETAEAFKRELNRELNIQAQGEAVNYDVLNQIYNQINKLSENKDLNISNNSNKRESFPPINKLGESEVNKTMDGFIEKLVNKFSFDSENKNEQLTNFVNTQVFKNITAKIESGTNYTYENNNENDMNDEEDLPRFGFSASKEQPKKDSIGAIHMNNSLDEILASASNEKFINQSQNNLNIINVINSPAQNAYRDSMSSITNIPNIANIEPNFNQNIINPNNTIKNDSNLDDDSLFAEESAANRRQSNNANNLNTLTSLNSINDMNCQLGDKFVPSAGLDNILRGSSNNNLFSLVNNENQDVSSFFNSHSVINADESATASVLELDEYVDDDDPGFDLYECDSEYFKDTCKKLAEQYDFPKRAILNSKFKGYEINANINSNDGNINSDSINNLKVINSKNIETVYKKNNNINNDPNKLFEVNTTSAGINSTNNRNNIKTLLPRDAKFMESGNDYFPVQFNNVIYDCFNLKVIVDRERTGFEENKEFKIIINSLVAGRYQIVQLLGSAAFSKAVKCLDIVDNRLVCLKIIENNKDYIDQSIDEIKLLRYINANGDPDEKSFLRVYDYFYHKEHLFIVTELLKDNLYDFYKYLNENNMATYFTLKRLQNITKQILTCLDFLHNLKLVHCDLKPENILMKSITDNLVKVIDFGSSCFIHDHLSTYVQSRSYRAPEVILGCKYDYKIDLWSLGCILAELFTGNVLFQNDSIQSLLARMMGICGPFPDWMLEKGKLVNDYFTKERLIFMEISGETNSHTGDVFSHLSKSQTSNKHKAKKMHIIVPKRTKLKSRLKTQDENFYDFIKCLLQVDPNLRLSAGEALTHPWMLFNYE